MTARCGLAEFDVGVCVEWKRRRSNVLPYKTGSALSKHNQLQLALPIVCRRVRLSSALCPRSVLEHICCPPALLSPRTLHLGSFLSLRSQAAPHPTAAGLFRLDGHGTQQPSLQPGRRGAAACRLIQDPASHAAANGPYHMGSRYITLAVPLQTPAQPPPHRSQPSPAGWRPPRCKLPPLSMYRVPPAASPRPWQPCKHMATSSVPSPSCNRCACCDRLAVPAGRHQMWRHMATDAEAPCSFHAWHIFILKC